MAHHSQDDGFHEIQLNGKQLVFLFMAATVVSVVIFLCGVLVGRGVRAERPLSDGTVASAPPTEPTTARTSPAAPPPADTDPRNAAPPAPADEVPLTYPDRLENSKAAKEALKKADKPAPVERPALVPQKPTPLPQKAATPAAPPLQKTAPQKPAPAAEATPAADAFSEFTVQIAAYNARGDAEAIARRLTSKGYPAYVAPPGNGAAMYRVRVGKFKTRHDAEPVAARLQKEESYKPWITR
ncbi:MAG TPA: SPOR domain-containing protein [Vicinamibacterales bacterium]